MKIVKNLAILHMVHFVNCAVGDGGKRLIWQGQQFCLLPTPPPPIVVGFTGFLTHLLLEALPVQIVKGPPPVSPAGQLAALAEPPPRLAPPAIALLVPAAGEGEADDEEDHHDEDVQEEVGHLLPLQQVALRLHLLHQQGMGRDQGRIHNLHRSNLDGN